MKDNIVVVFFKNSESGIVNANSWTVFVYMREGVGNVWMYGIRSSKLRRIIMTMYLYYNDRTFWHTKNHHNSCQKLMQKEEDCPRNILISINY